MKQEEQKTPYYITGMSEAHNFIKQGMHPGIANGVCAQNGGDIASPRRRVCVFFHSLYVLLTSNNNIEKNNKKSQ